MTDSKRCPRPLLASVVAHHYKRELVAEKRYVRDVY